MSNSTHLELPFLETAQAQKHVTLNDALNRLDALTHLGVESVAETAPPLSPTEGARWIVASPATGEWTGQEGKVAAWIDGAWVFLNPKPGWRAWNKSMRTELIHHGGDWKAGPASTTAALTTNRAATRIETIELDHVIVAGAFNDTSLTIPDRAIVLGVTGLVLTDVTGPASWALGVSADDQRYGNMIGVSGGSIVNGVSGSPTAYYAPTLIRVSATGSDFTGGSLRLACHYLLLDVPSA